MSAWHTLITIDLRSDEANIVCEVLVEGKHVFAIVYCP